jgi:hypothetical protein
MCIHVPSDEGINWVQVVSVSFGRMMTRAAVHMSQSDPAVNPSCGSFVALFAACASLFFLTTISFAVNIPIIQT